MEYARIQPEAVGLQPVILDKLWKKTNTQYRHFVVPEYIKVLRTWSYKEVKLKGLVLEQSEWDLWKKQDFKSQNLSIVRSIDVFNRIPLLEMVQEGHSLTKESQQALIEYINLFPATRSKTLIVELLRAVREGRQVLSAHRLMRYLMDPYLKSYRSEPFLTPKERVFKNIEEICKSMNATQKSMFAKTLFTSFISPTNWKTWVTHSKYPQIAAVCVFQAFRYLNQSIPRHDFYKALDCTISGFQSMLVRLSSFFAYIPEIRKEITQNLLVRITNTLNIPLAVVQDASKLLQKLPSSLQYSKPEILVGMVIGYSSIINGFRKLRTYQLADALQVSQSSINWRIKQLAKIRGDTAQSIPQLIKMYHE